MNNENLWFGGKNMEWTDHSIKQAYLEALNDGLLDVINKLLVSLTKSLFSNKYKREVISNCCLSRQRLHSDSLRKGVVDEHIRTHGVGTEGPETAWGQMIPVVFGSEELGHLLLRPLSWTNLPVLNVLTKALLERLGEHCKLGRGGLEFL